MLAPARARAACPGDSDGDGYSLSGTSGGCVIGVPDCDDGDANVNPGEFETLSDGIDNECDGRDAMARYFSSGFFNAATWPGTGVFSYTGDTVQVGDPGAFARSTVTRTVGIPRSRGATGVMVDVALLTGPGCTIELDTTPWGASFPVTTHDEPLIATGTNWIPFPTVQPRHILRAVRVACMNFSRAEIDWIQVQNADEAMPPPADITLAWTDTRMPGGGYIESVVRDDGLANLWMGTDVAGVAIGDRDWPGFWEVNNGAGTSSLMMQGNLGVADMEPMANPDDGVYVLMGDVTNPEDGDRTLVGGLWWTGDEGNTWSQLGSSWSDTYGASAGVTWADTGDDIGGFGLETNCPGTRAGEVTWEGGGGRLIQADDIEPGVPGQGEVIYVANADDDAMGVSIYAAGQTCALPNDGTALPAEHVGAILRVDLPLGTPSLLLVGYRGRVNAGEGVYACELPAWPLDCALPAGLRANCWPVDGTDGVDVRDIEPDTLAEALGDLAVYVVDGGTRPVDADSDGVGDATCNHDESALHRIALELDAFGNVVDTWVPGLVVEGDIDMLSPTTDYFMTDASMDPTSEWVFINLGPASSAANYFVDRLYRAESPLVPLGTATWEPVNSGDPATPFSDLDYYERIRQSANLDLGGAWLESTINGQPHSFPARAAPGEGHSTIWVDGAFGDYAVVSGWANAWMVEGLSAGWYDDETDPVGTPDIDTLAQPEGDVDWTFWPDISPGYTYQTFVAHEVAWDSSGTLWTVAGDHGVLQYDPAHWLATGEGAAIDCLWKGFPAGSVTVSVGLDGSVWAGLLDESTSDGRHQMAVVRTLDQGATWAYAGAGYDSAFMDETTGEHWCMDKDFTHAAVPFDAGTATWPGSQFWVGMIDPINPPTDTQPSLGNPVDVRALDANAALVLFQPESGTGSPGGLYLTVDGGVTWDAVPFDPGTGTVPCDETLTWQKGTFELVHPGGEYTYWVEDEVTGDVSWSFDLIFSVELGTVYGSYPSSAGPTECSLARILVTDDGTGQPQADWDWIPLEKFHESENTCGVSGQVIEGATIAPWSEDIVIWGGYRRFFGSDPYQITTRYGGACIMNWSDPGVDYWGSSTGAYDTYTMLMNPAVDELSVGWVAPHPEVADLYAILPSLDLGTRKQCEVVRDPSTHAACPDFPYPRLASRTALGGWTVTTLATHPPSGLPMHAAWSPLGVADDQGGNGHGHWLGVALAGSGAWRGEVQW